MERKHKNYAFVGFVIDISLSMYGIISTRNSRMDINAIQMIRLGLHFYYVTQMQKHSQYSVTTKEIRRCKIPNFVILTSNYEN
jgi:hypothetical protein